MPDSPAATPMDWALITLLGVIWGASFMAVTLALETVGPIWVAAGRIGLAAVAILVVARVTGLGLPSPAAPSGARIWAHAAAMGVFSNAAPFLLLAWGQQHVASGFAGITMAVIPLFTLALAHFLVPGERMTVPRAAGFGMGLCGVVLLIGPGVLAAKGEAAARLACIAAAACYAIGSIVTRRCPPVALVQFSAAALLVAAVLALPVALAIDGVPRPGAGVPGLALVYLGLGPTALATLILVRVIRSAGPAFLAQVNYQVPVWAVIFGVVLLGESLPPQFLGALGLILAGLAASRMRPWRRGG